MRLCLQQPPPTKRPNGNSGLPPSLERTAPQEVRQTGRERGGHQHRTGKPAQPGCCFTIHLGKLTFQLPSAKQSGGWGQAVGGFSSSANCSRGNNELSCRGAHVCPAPVATSHGPITIPALWFLKWGWDLGRPRLSLGSCTCSPVQEGTVGHTQPSESPEAKGTPSSPRMNKTCLTRPSCALCGPGDRARLGGFKSMEKSWLPLAPGSGWGGVCVCERETAV